MFAESWLRSKRPPVTKPSYYTTLERAWKNHVAPFWQTERSGPSDVPKFKIGCLSSHRGHPRIVVLRALRALAGILDVAIDDRLLASNPARNVRGLLRGRPGKCRITLSHEQVATLATCSAHPTLVLTLTYVGLPWDEATGLRVRSVSRYLRLNGLVYKLTHRCETQSSRS